MDFLNVIPYKISYINSITKFMYSTSISDKIKTKISCPLMNFFVKDKCVYSNLF